MFVWQKTKWLLKMLFKNADQLDVMHADRKFRSFKSLPSHFRDVCSHRPIISCDKLTALLVGASKTKTENCFSF